MHLVGFPIEIYHDARSYKRQTSLRCVWFSCQLCIIKPHVAMRALRYTCTSVRTDERAENTVKHFQNNFLTLANDLYLLSLFVLFQNDTMRVLYAYHSEDPTARPESKLATLLYHGPTQRGFRSLYLMERVNLEEPPPRDLLSWDLKNPMVIYVSYVV